jgi:hypothetical protein
MAAALTGTGFFRSRQVAREVIEIVEQNLRCCAEVY